MNAVRPQEPRMLLDGDTLGVLAAAVALIGSGYAIWEQIPVNLHVVASAVSMACYVAAFVLMLLAPSTRVRRDLLALGGLLFAFVAYAGLAVTFLTRYYGTDSLLFNAYAAQLLAHGIDPYTQSMEPAFRAFGVPDSLVTPTVNGHAVFTLSYPALSFLIYVPALLLHAENLLWFSVVAHAGLIVALWYLAPRPLRALLPLLVFVDVSYVQYTVGAVTDVLWVLPAVFAAAWWSTRPMASATLLGIACAVKQTPWLLVPFAVVDWGRTAWRERSLQPVAAPAAALATAFLIPNVPFIAWHPGAWAAGVAEPLSGHLVMFGSGLVQLQTSNVVPLDPRLLSGVALAFLVGAFLVYALVPGRFPFLPYVAPGIAYFLAPRSLQNYFMYWPIVLAARATRAFVPEPAPSAAFGAFGRRYAVPALGGVVLVTVALLAGGAAYARYTEPLLAIQSVKVDPSTGLVTDVRLRADGGHRAPRFVRFALFRAGSGVSFQFLGSDIARLDAQPRTLDLAIPRRLGAIGAHDAVQIVAVDAFNGQQFFSRARVVDVMPFLVRNPALTVWSPPPNPMPVGWDYDEGDVRSGRVRRLGRALQFNVNVPRDAEWAVASVSQVINASPGSLGFRLRPRSNYDGDAYPRKIFGIEIVDAYQNHTYYTIDARLKAPRVYRRDRFVVNVLPGKLDAWNNVRVKVAPSRAGGPFLPSTATERINVVAAVRQGEHAPVRGTFGGVFEEH